MELSEHHITFIRKDLRAKGITNNSLLESLVDHICCRLESCPEDAGFDESYADVLRSFGKKGIIELQEETQRLLTLNKEEKMKKVMYFIGFIAIFLISNGLLFKLLHWKTANVQLLMGFVLLNLCFLPWYFYNQYKRSITAEIK